MPEPSSFCFVHAADLHLDTPFRGLGSLAPEVASLLRDASLDAFDAVVDLALERRAAFVVLAGDIYDGPERGLRAQLRLRDGLGRLGAAGVASFLVHGNHDPLESGWSAISRWPEGTTVFPAAASDDEPARVVPVLRRGELIATVQGVSYATRSTSENLARRLSRPPAVSSPEPVHVGVLHCNVAGAPGSGGHADYSPCSVSDLRATRLDYLALGHVHQRAVLCEGSGPGDPWVVYPGNTQAHSWRAGERGAKGAYVVHVESARVVEVEFVACDQVRFEDLSCPIGDAADLGALGDRLAGLADEAASRAGGRPVVLRAELTGAGVLHEQLARPGVLDELLAHARDETAGCEPLRWWDSLRDETLSAREATQPAGRGDFAADLVELAGSWAGGGLDDDAARGVVAGLPRQLAQRAGALLAGERLSGLVERAARRALDELALEDA
jgi:DNA repair exonuclease SbcCD nuclease subunit